MFHGVVQGSELLFLFSRVCNPAARNDPEGDRFNTLLIPYLCVYLSVLREAAYRQTDVMTVSMYDEPAVFPIRDQSSHPCMDAEGLSDE
jgi:hypothetical protein